MKTKLARLVALILLFFGGPPVAMAQDGFVSIPQSVMNTIGTLLPETSNAGAAYISQTYSPNIEVKDLASISVTFVWEGAGYRNSLGYFTYEEQPDGSVDILSSNLLIPDASFPSVGSAVIGDTYDLRDETGAVRFFQPGEKVGFFVVADGWNREPLIKAWDPAAVAIPSNDPLVNATFGRGCYTTIDKLNYEFAQGSLAESRHVAMIWMQDPNFQGGDPFLITGFEDLLRTGRSDDDFNDLLFIVQATPYTAIEDTPAFVYGAGDPDGDGISGVNDHYPNDPTRAFVTRLPSNGEHTLGFEDQYPNLGDADYNDVVLAYHYELVSDASGDVKDLQLTAHFVARGAGYDHSIGLHLPGLPDDATGTVDVQRFLSDDQGTVQLEPTRSLAEVIGQDGRRVDDLIVSTRDALPSLLFGTFTNTQSATIDRTAASVRLLMSFDEAIDPEVLGTAPYDLYVSVLRGGEAWDVHMPGFPGFDDRPAHLPVEEGAESFLDDQGRPWLFAIPTSWRFPMEHVRVWEAYPSFQDWASSAGQSFTSWYDDPTSQTGLLGFDLTQYIPIRNWSVELPTP